MIMIGNYRPPFILYNRVDKAGAATGMQRHEICWMQVKKEWRQVNEKIKRNIIIYIWIVENVQETSSDTGMHNRAITVLHNRECTDIGIKLLPAEGVSLLFNTHALFM